MHNKQQQQDTLFSYCSVQFSSYSLLALGSRLSYRLCLIWKVLFQRVRNVISLKGASHYIASDRIGGLLYSFLPESALRVWYLHRQRRRRRSCGCCSCWWWWLLLRHWASRRTKRVLCYPAAWGVGCVPIASCTYIVEKQGRTRSLANILQLGCHWVKTCRRNNWWFLPTAFQRPKGLHDAHPGRHYDVQLIWS